MKMRKEINGGWALYKGGARKQINDLAKVKETITGRASQIPVLLQGCPVHFSEEEGQGTTEYAILVGVLVLIAIVAVIAFRDKISELWNSIAEGINSL